MLIISSLHQKKNSNHQQEKKYFLVLIFLKFYHQIKNKFYIYTSIRYE